MFERADMEAIKSSGMIDRMRTKGYPGLYYVSFPHHAFRHTCSEEYIRITRAPKRSDDNGIIFWFNSEWGYGWECREEYFEPYLRNALFEQIGEEEFDRIVDQSSADLIAPLQRPLHPATGFVGALKMYCMEADIMISLLAEYEDEFIHFFWETTA